MSILEHLKKQLITKKGVSEINDFQFSVSPDAPTQFINNVLNGKGIHSFILRYYYLLLKRLKASEQSELILENVLKQECYLEEVDLGKHQELNEKEGLKFEVLLTGRWGLLDDMDTVIEDSTKIEVIEDVKKKKKEYLNLLCEDTSKISRQLTNFYQEIMEIKQSEEYPRNLNEETQYKLDSFKKICSSKLMLVNRLSNRKGIDSQEVYLEELRSLKLKLIYIIHTLSHVTNLNSRITELVFDRLLLVQLYFNILKDIENVDYENLKFSDDCNLEVHFIPPVKGKKVSEVNLLLNEITQSPKFSDRVAEKFFDQIMFDLIGRDLEESFDQKNRGALLALQCWILKKFFYMRLSKMIVHFDVLKKQINTFFQDQKKPYLPKELFSIFFDVSFVLASLLKRKKDINEIFAKKNYQKYRFLNHDPRLKNLNYFGSVLFESPLRPGIKSLKYIIAGFLDALLDICSYYQSSGEENNVHSLEVQFRNYLKEINYRGTILDAIFDKEVFAEVMNQPWVKNQSMNKKILIELARVCQILAMVVSK